MAQQSLQTLQSLATHLRTSGKSDAEISTIADGLVKAAFTLLFSNAMAAFTEEDIAEIEQCETDNDTNTKIMELYQKRTGKNPSDELDMFLEKTVAEFLQDLQNNPQA